MVAALLTPYKKSFTSQQIRRPPPCPDIGIFVSFDAVSIDQACVEMVNQISNKDLFLEQHPDRDWRKQLEHAEEIGLGSCSYELTEIK